MSDNKTIQRNAVEEELKGLIEQGKQKGFLTYEELNDSLPDDVVSPEYIDEVTAKPAENDADNGGEPEYDEHYDAAVALVTRTRQASISMIQRHLRIGYNRAARIIETMEREGVVGPADGAKPREVLARNLDETM